MVESLIPDRLKFNRKGDQKRFILNAKKKLGLTWVLFAQTFGVSTRTLTSWRSEKLKMSAKVAKKISNLSHMKIPENALVISWQEHLKRISSKGGKNNFLKNKSIGGDTTYRNLKWRQWWNTEGALRTDSIGRRSLISIKKPEKSKNLSEFVGIMIGDGGVAKYHIAITISSKEKQYLVYIKKLIVKLFNVAPKVYKKKEAEAIEVVLHRKELVSFCKEIGLVQGDKIKQRVDLPLWVKKKKTFSIACIRGLVDTDGCFYVNKYISNGKKYQYLKMAFVSASPALINSFSELLRKLGINSVIDKKHRSVRIVESESLEKYINKIGTNNAKHLKKINEWKIN